MGLAKNSIVNVRSGRLVSEPVMVVLAFDATAVERTG